MTWQELVDWMRQPDVQAAVARYEDDEEEESQPEQMKVSSIVGVAGA